MFKFVKSQNKKEIDIEKVLKYNNKNFVSICATLFLICAIISYICIPYTDSLSLITGIVFTIFAIALWGIVILFKIKSSKVIARYGLDEIKKELLSANTIKVDRTDTYLTDKYIISNNITRGVEITKYSDIVWIYPVRMRGINGITSHATAYATNKLIGGSPLRAHLKNGKMVVTAIPKDVIGMETIFNKIHQNNKEVLFGYSKKNIDKYNKLFPMNKRKNIITYIIILIVIILGTIVARNM